MISAVKYVWKTLDVYLNIGIFLFFYDFSLRWLHFEGIDRKLLKSREILETIYISASDRQCKKWKNQEIVNKQNSKRPDTVGKSVFNFHSLAKFYSRDLGNRSPPVGTRPISPYSVRPCPSRPRPGKLCPGKPCPSRPRSSRPRPSKPCPMQATPSQTMLKPATSWQPRQATPRQAMSRQAKPRQATPRQAKLDEHCIEPTVETLWFSSSK